MTYTEAYEKLEGAGQAQLLRYYGELTPEAQQELLQQIADADFSVIEMSRKQGRQQRKGRITPLLAMQISEIEQSREAFVQTGLEAIRAGKVGAVLLAGGMGTRLGSEEPKGMYDIGITRPVYIFERQIANLLEVVEQAGAWVPLFLMTSSKNHDETAAFLKEHDYFGYREDYITFFRQEMAPATDFEGRVYLEEKGKLSSSPNGNGGWFISMQRTGALDIVREKGVEWLNVFSVDNVLQRIADPCFVGAVIRKNCACGAKVVKKSAPNEKVGVMCLEDGRPSIVEYYELTEEMMSERDGNGELAYNFGVILNYLFREKELEEMLEQELPLHIVEKKIPYIDAYGNKVYPEQPNGFKYETLVLDMIHNLDSCLPYEVERRREFAPVKNRTGVDSVDSARLLLRENGIEL